jgi:hypothetical protein
MMRHSRVQLSLDVYAQARPEGQRRAVEQLERYTGEAVDAGDYDRSRLVTIN